MKNTFNANMQGVHSQLQEWLIAIALMIVIPTTVYLGVALVAPKVDFNRYYQAQNDFFKDYSKNDKEAYSQRQVEWEKSSVFLEHKAHQCEKKGLMLVVSGMVSVLLFFLGSLFTLPVISLSLLISGIHVFMINIFIYAPCQSYQGVNMHFIEMLFSLVSLLIVLWFAYQSSESKDKSLDKSY